MQQAQISRRRFLASSGVLPMAMAGSSGLAVRHGVAQEAVSPDAVPEDWPAFPGVPETPVTLPPEGFQVFTEDEAAIVEALTARIMPGTPDDPGAREAGVVYYIDYLLTQNDGFVEPVYLIGPFARGYEGDTEPEPEEGVIWVPAEELARYGAQAPLSPREIYRIGIAAIEDHANQQYGNGLASLSGEDQDQIIWDLLDESVPLREFSGHAFFQVLRQHTVEGMFSDPGYGGNRDLVGWRLIGFPGSQRMYTPEEVTTVQPRRDPMTMNDLPVFHPGQTEEGPVLPVRGTDPEDGGQD